MTPASAAGEATKEEPPAGDAAAQATGTGEPVGEPASEDVALAAGGDSTDGQPTEGQHVEGQPEEAQSIEARSGEAQSEDAPKADDSAEDNEATTEQETIEVTADGSEETSEPEGEPEATEPTETHIPTARRASVIAAGLIGALIALGVYLGLYYGGILPRDQSTVTETLQAQSQDFGRRLASLESSVAREAKRGLATEVEDLKSALQELGSDPKNALVKRVRKLEDSVATMAGSATDGTGMAALESRLSGIEGSLSKAGDSISTGAQAQLSDIVKRIEALELRPATGKNGEPVDASATIAALSERIAALDTQLQATNKQVTELAKSGAASAQETLTQLGANLKSMHSELDTLSAAVTKSASTVDEKFAAFQKSLSERDDAAMREVARTTAGALAVTNLIKVADTGEPYAAELDVLRPLVDDKTDLAVLDAHAKTGVPDVQTLIAQFGSVSNDILAASDPSQDGIVGNLLTSARSLVQVRPVGQVEGEGRGATVSRIESALQAGDLKSADSEWSSLDSEAQKVSKSWADDLKARIAVNDALDGLSSALTASLSGEAAAPVKAQKTKANGSETEPASAPAKSEPATN